MCLCCFRSKMSDCCGDASVVHTESCVCHHQSLSDIREFVDIVCYYNCKICEFSCTNVGDIKSHMVDSHRTFSTVGMVFNSKLKADASVVSNHDSILQMPKSELLPTATNEEAHDKETPGLVSKEFSTISQSGCDFLSSAVVTHSADHLALHPLHTAVSGQMLQLFVSNQDVQLNIPNYFSGDGISEVAALPASVSADLCVTNSHANSSIRPVDAVKAAGSTVPLVQSGVGHAVESSEQVTEMFVCDSCGTVFNGVGIVEHMLQVHGILLDSVNFTSCHATPSDQMLPSACTGSSETAMPPNTVSTGTQAQLAKKPGRKRKLNVDAATLATADELNNKQLLSSAEKDNAALMAVRTLGIERLSTAGTESGSAKRRIHPPRALVEDYHIHRLRQSKPRSRSTVSTAAKLQCTIAGCSVTFKHYEALSYHVTCHLDTGVFCCPECCSCFLSWTSMLPHLWTVHGVDMYAYRCSRCQFRADSSATITQHSITEHPAAGKSFQSFLCSVCGQTFNKAHLRNQHEKSHNSRTRLISARHQTRSELVAFRRCVCDLCKRSFADKKSLKNHVQVSDMLLLSLINACKYFSEILLRFLSCLYL